MISSPGSSQKWKTAQNGDLFGNLVRSKNLNFDRDGYLRLARKAMALYSSKNDANFGTIVCIDADDSNLFVVTTDHVFIIAIDEADFSVTEYTASDRPNPSISSDGIFYGATTAKYHVSDNTKIKYYTVGSNDWTDTGISLTSGNPHPLCESEHQGYLAVGDGNKVKLYDSTYSLITTLTIPARYLVTCIRWDGNQLYVGTRNIVGGAAKVFRWNGSGTAAQSGYSARANWVYSMCEHVGAIAIVTSAGQFMRWNGAGFTPFANLPVYFTSYSWLSNAAVSSLIGNVASRGMASHGDLLHISLNGSISMNASQPPGPYMPDQPSGIWEFDPEVGLYHKAAFNRVVRKFISPTEIASNALVFAVDHGAETGDSFLYANHGAIVGLDASNTAGHVYYAIKIGDRALKVALSPADALAGRAITISGTPSASDDFAFETYDTVGITDVVNPGPVFVVSALQPPIFYGTEIIFGGSVLDSDMSATIPVLMSLGMGRNIGYFITPKMVSSAVTDLFEKLVAFIDKLALDTDSIQLKYRTRERFGIPPLQSFDGSYAEWTDTNKFSANSLSYDLQGIIVGDEVEITRGAGAGYIAQITDIDKTAPDYIFTLDRSFPVTPGDMFDFTVDNWLAWKTIANTSKDLQTGFAELGLGKKGNWIQFKVILYGFEVAISGTDLVNASNRPGA